MRKSKRQMTRIDGQGGRRQKEAPRQTELQLSVQAERKRLRRQAETPEETERRRRAAAEHMRRRRQNETPEETALRLAEVRERMRLKRQNETVEQTQARRARDLERIRRRRHVMSEKAESPTLEEVLPFLLEVEIEQPKEEDEEELLFDQTSQLPVRSCDDDCPSGIRRSRRQMTRIAGQCKWKQTEAPRQTKRRLSDQAERNRLRLLAETPEEAQRRKRTAAEYMRQRRQNETPEETARRLAQVRERNRLKRQNETPEQTQARRACEAERIRCRRRLTSEQVESSMLKETLPFPLEVQLEVEIEQSKEEDVEELLFDEASRLPVMSCDGDSPSGIRKSQRQITRTAGQGEQKRTEAPRHTKRRLLDQAERKRLRRLAETPEEGERQKQTAAEYMRQRRQNETPKETAQRLAQVRKRMRLKRQNETPEQTQARRAREAERIRRRRHLTSEQVISSTLKEGLAFQMEFQIEQLNRVEEGELLFDETSGFPVRFCDDVCPSEIRKSQRQMTRTAGQCGQRQTEAPCQSELQLLVEAERKRPRRLQETPDEAERRKLAAAQRMRQRRQNETQEETARRLAQVRERMRLKRQNETLEQTQARRAREAERIRCRRHLTSEQAKSSTLIDVLPFPLEVEQSKEVVEEELLFDGTSRFPDRFCGASCPSPSIRIRRSQRQMTRTAGQCGRRRTKAPRQTELQLSVEAERKRLRRLAETLEETERRRRAAAEHMRRRRQKETPEETAQRLAHVRERMRLKRQNETPEQTQARRAGEAERARRRRHLMSEQAKL